jgi:hypothetical protein
MGVAMVDEHPRDPPVVIDLHHFELEAPLVAPEVDRDRQRLREVPSERGFPADGGGSPSVLVTSRDVSSIDSA